MDRTHIGITCPYCQFPLKADSEVVVCAACRIPHHRECWAENGGCTTFGCQGEQAVTELPAVLERTLLEGAVQTSLMHLPPGSLLRDNYILGGVLGQCRHVITYIARDLNMDLPVVIKEYFPQHLVTRLPDNDEVKLYSEEFQQEYDQGLQCFLSEAERLETLSRPPNLTAFRDFFQANRTVYFVFSYLAGVIFDQYLGERNGSLPAEEALGLLLPLCEALEALHRSGLVHLKINPINILINNDGRAVLIGLGFNRQKIYNRAIDLLSINQPGYAALEQYIRSGTEGPWTDIYALGGTIYRSITGKVPPDAINRLISDSLHLPSNSGIELSNPQEEALIKALALKTEERFQDVNSFCEAFCASSVVMDRRANQTLCVTLDDDEQITPFYRFDYNAGTIALSDLPIGVRVVDPSWQWQFRTGNSYSGEGEVKAVTWIVVAKDHYGHDSGVTLMSEEIIGKYCFENREGVLALMKTGLNHWEDSSSNTQGERLRSWLNATGIQSSEAFYKAFSNNFKQAVLSTNLPNKDWKNGNVYRTWDRVFIPSTTELGDQEHRYTHRIGSIYPYYREANNAKRAAKAGSRNWWYWTRSPNLEIRKCVCGVDTDGAFSVDYAFCNDIGVRPALNLKANILVSEIRN